MKVIIIELDHEMFINDRLSAVPVVNNTPDTQMDLKDYARPVNNINTVIIIGKTKIKNPENYDITVVKPVN